VVFVTRLKAHFDGKVIVPDEPVHLPANTALVLHFEQAQPEAEPQWGTAAYLAKHLEPMSDEDADQMRQAIAEADTVDPDPDVNLD